LVQVSKTELGNASTFSALKSTYPLTINVFNADHIVHFQPRNNLISSHTNTTLISACETTPMCNSFVEAPASPALPQAQPFPLRLFGLFRDTTIIQTSYKKHTHGSCLVTSRRFTRGRWFDPECPNHCKTSFSLLRPKTRSTGTSDRRKEAQKKDLARTRTGDLSQSTTVVGPKRES
jgi:hypothetical protein